MKINFFNETWFSIILTFNSSAEALHPCHTPTADGGHPEVRAGARFLLPEHRPHPHTGKMPRSGPRACLTGPVVMKLTGASVEDGSEERLACGSHLPTLRARGDLSLDACWLLEAAGLSAVLYSRCRTGWVLPAPTNQNRQSQQVASLFSASAAPLTVSRLTPHRVATFGWGVCQTSPHLLVLGFKSLLQ